MLNINKAVKFLKKYCIFVAAAALILVIVFCATIPVCKQYFIYTKTATGADSNIIEMDYFNKDGNIVKNEKYTEGEIYSVTENVYSGKNITESKIYYWDELFETTKYEYKDKLLITKTVYDTSDAIVNTETYYYDEKDVLINSVVTDENGTQSFRYDYLYKDGLLSKKVLYDVENDYTRVTTYTYEDGRLVSEKVTAGAYHNNTTEYTYNSKGHVAMKKSDSLENGYVSYTYEYRTKRVTVFAKIF